MVSQSPSPGSLCSPPSPAGGEGFDIEPSPLEGEGGAPPVAQQRGGEGEGAISRFGLDLIQKRFENAFEIGEDIIVPESDHAVAATFQVGGPRRVSLGRMLSSVDFDDEATLMADEVGDIGANRHLSAEFQTIELASADRAPELLFGLRLVAPKPTGPVDHVGIRFRGFCHFIAPSPGSRCSPPSPAGGEGEIAPEGAEIQLLETVTPSPPGGLADGERMRDA